jgi:hypothetical protein
LTDIDEDECLSPEDIFKMLLAIERNFIKESSFIDPESSISLSDLATRRALTRFTKTFPEKHEVSNKKEKGKKKVETLRDFDAIVSDILSKEMWFGKILPKETPLRRVLANTIDVPRCHLHFHGEPEKEDFDKFLGTLHSSLWPAWTGNKEKDSKYGKENKDTKDIKKLEKKLGILQRDEPYHIPVKFKLDVYDIPFPERREEKKNVEKGGYRDEDLGTHEKSGFKEHEERLLKMKQMKLEKVEDTQRGKTMANKKELFMKPKDNRAIDGILKETQLPNLSELVDHRVNRLKRTLKYGYEGYGNYLLKKLGVPGQTTDRASKNDDELTRQSPSPPRNKSGSNL